MPILQISRGIRYDRLVLFDFFHVFNNFAFLVFDNFLQLFLVICGCSPSPIRFSFNFNVQEPK